MSIDHDTDRTDAGTDRTDAPPVTGRLRDLAAQLVSFLETGAAPAGLFTDDVFCDFTLPTWRMQALGRDHVTALRTDNHPGGGRVPRTRLDATSTGFLLEVEEEWEADGHTWYCRELMRADVVDDGISALSVYCTGDWDEEHVAAHRAAVTLVRP
jgi:hypothetical protein